MLMRLRIIPILQVCLLSAVIGCTNKEADPLDDIMERAEVAEREHIANATPWNLPIAKLFRTQQERSFALDVSLGNLAGVRNHLQKGVDVNTTGIGDVPIIALALNYPESVTLLLENNANAEVEFSGITTLGLFSLEGNAKSMESLLAHGVDVNKVFGVNSLSPLLLAVQRTDLSRMELVNLLLKHGVNVNYAIPQGQGNLLYPAGTTALHVAAKFGHFDTALILLENGAQANAATEYGETIQSIIAKQFRQGRELSSEQEKMMHTVLESITQ